MIPTEIDWGPNGVRVIAYSRDVDAFRRCIHLDCDTVLSRYNGWLYCSVHLPPQPPSRGRLRRR